MTSRTLFRLSGTSLLFGSVLSIIYYLIQGLFLTGHDLATILGAPSLISSIIGFIGSLFVLLGLPGLYMRQAARAGVLGLIGLVCLWYVTLFQGVVIPFTTVTIISQLTAHLGTPALATTMPPAWAPFDLVSQVCQVLGVPLLAVATLRARVFPRWPAWMLIAALVVSLIGFLPFVPEDMGNIGPIIASVAIVWLGYVLIAPEGREVQQTLPVGT